MEKRENKALLFFIFLETMLASGACLYVYTSAIQSSDLKLRYRSQYLHCLSWLLQAALGMLVWLPAMVLGSPWHASG
jgi:hypothetical protein